MGIQERERQRRQKHTFPTPILKIRRMQRAFPKPCPLGCQSAIACQKGRPKESQKLHDKRGLLDEHARSCDASKDHRAITDGARGNNQPHMALLKTLP